MSISEVDRLLEQYLHLLDNYSTLRSQLSSLQSSIYQDIARANFTAERGIRYGADSYDARMQATRLLHITTRPPSPPAASDVEKPPSQSQTEEPIPTFTIALASAPTPSSSPPAAEPDIPQRPSAAEGLAKPTSAESTVSKKESDSTTPAPQPKPRDPLRQFGLLVPASLRSAQSSAVQLVAALLPQLAGVDAEMRAVEIAVRRARKRARKAEKLAEGGDVNITVRGSGDEFIHEDECGNGNSELQGEMRHGIKI